MYIVLLCTVAEAGQILISLFDLDVNFSCTGMCMWPMATDYLSKTDDPKMLKKICIRDNSGPGHQFCSSTNKVCIVKDPSDPVYSNKKCGLSSRELGGGKNTDRLWIREDRIGKYFLMIPSWQWN